MGLVAMVVLHLVGLILAVLDFSLWLLTLGPMWMVLKLLSRPGKQVVKVGEGDVNDEGMPPSPVYRLAGARDALTATYDESVGTVYDLLSRSARLFAEKPAQAWRAFEKFVYLNEGDRFPAKVFGDIQTATYAQLGEQAHAFGAGLRAMGMEPMPEAGDDLEDKSGPFKMLIFEDTSAEWMVAAQGAFTQSMVVFTAYATLGMDAVVDAVQVP
uniref:AMP-dependent synthetase/ligase domain-containing protein n=1 Tax=Phaeomonas parva TaxID=124430 RepID=A0A7S1UAK4_9STRA